MTNEEEEVLKQNDDYLTEINTKVCPVLDDLKLYKEAVQRDKRRIKSHRQQAERTLLQTES